MKENKSSKKIKKKLIKRSVSMLLAFALLLNETYIWSILDDFSDKSISSTTIKASAAEETPVFTNYTNEATKEISIPIEDFVEYSIDCQNNPESHQLDKITITSTGVTDFFESGFAGLGTEDKPFGGSISIIAGNTIPLNLDAPLFNYVYDNVELNNNAPLKISRGYQSGLGTDETTPIVAKNVVNAEGSATWSIDFISPSDSNTHYMSNFGGFIGEMQAGTEVDLTVTMNSTDGDAYSIAIVGSGDLGLACCHMEAGANLTFTYTANRELSKIETSGGDVGGLVGEMESGAVFTLKNENAVTSGIDITTSAGSSYAGGLVGKNVGGTVTIYEAVNNSSSTEDGEETPADGGEDTPAEGGEETPADGGENTPAEGGEDTPVEGGEETPAEGGEDTPAEGGEDTPAEGGEDTPAEGGEDTPAEGGEDTPAEGGEDTPAEGGEETPADGGEETPAEGGEGTPAEEEGSNESENEESEAVDNSTSDVPAVYPITQHITGTSGAGGVYGYYKPNTALTDENSFDTSKFNINCQVNGSGYTGGLFGVLDTTANITINGGGNVASNHYAGSCTGYGGLIGQYKADSADRALTISSVTATPSKSGTATYYGGGIGQIDTANPAYVEFSSFTVNATNAGSLTFGGLVASADKAFIKTTGSSITASGYMGGGLVGRLANGVLEISGINTITGASVTPASGKELQVGRIVGYRDNGLVFMDTGASCTCGAAEVDDIGAWGGVIKLGGFTTPANVLSVSNHAVTVGTSGYTFTSISDKDDFAVTALRFQIDGSESGTGNPFVTFANTSKTSSTIASADISLSGAVTLTGTGIYGLTRDNDIGSTMAKCEYSGTFGNASTAYTITFDTGTIYRHKYNGLFAKLNNAAPATEGGEPTGGTVRNVIFAGKIDVNAKTDMYVGAATAKATGNFTANSVTVNTIFDYAGAEELYLGGILGEADSSIGTINVIGCNVNAKINGSNSSAILGGVIGQISHNSDEDKSWNFRTIKVGGEIINSSSGKIGGLVAVVLGGYNGNSNHRAITLNGITVDDLTVSGSSADSMGGLLGYSWLKADVNVSSVIVNSGSSITNSDDGGIGGMVYRATGKWTVTSLDVKGIEVSGTEGTPSIGMIVNRGISHDDAKFYTEGSRSAIYLCLPSGYTYNITSSTLPTVSVFDELCAYTAPDTDPTNILRNGNGVISINTTFRTDGSTASGSYHARTAKGASANPNSRYYYNLDTVTANSSSNAILTYNESTNPNAYKNQLMSWGLNQYACTNLQQYFADVFDGAIANYEYDMQNYSWYPVDLDKNITVNGQFKFYSHEFEVSEDVKAGNETNSFDRTNLGNNQHYTMHCGLFRNVSSGNTLTIGTTVFKGDVGLIDGESGALICGTVQGASNTSKATVQVSDSGSVSLDGVYVYGATTGNSPNYAPLLINKVGSYVNLTIANVGTTDSYSTAQKAASSLIGDVGSSSAIGIIVDFKNIKLDGRTANVTDNGYNTELNSAYGTSETIFTRSTLLNSFKYASGSTGTYNYKRSEDWNNVGTVYHHYNVAEGQPDTEANRTYLGVTYGKELGYDTDHYPKTGTLSSPYYNTQYPGEEDMYAAEIVKNAETGEDEEAPRIYYTNPINALDDSEGNYAAQYISSFLPYVYEKYSAANKTYQLQVNHGPSSATGCGTYNDPYIIASGSKLESICHWINSGFNDGDKICIPYNENTAFASEKVSEKTYRITSIDGTWCDEIITEEEASGEGDDETTEEERDHLEFIYQGGAFQATVGEGTAQITYTISNKVMRTYLAGAYYKIPDTVGTITIPSNDKITKSYFDGLGNTTDDFAVFRGVIDGSDMTLINKTGHPLIESSNGSVVKDLTIGVRPIESITLESANAAFGTTVGDGSTYNSAYGAVISKIFGGDNIIDNVSISLGTESSKATITLTGSNSQLTPVGGYVGVVINGGLYFRNMARFDVKGDPALYGENLFSNVTLSCSEVTGISVSDSNTKWLYVNPIVGRVINGFAVTESGVSKDGGVTYTEDPAYRPFEDGTRQYPDETDDTDDTWAAGHVTMQNGTKNYSITDINSSLPIFTMMNGNSVSGEDGATVTVSNAQSLFIISLITEAGLGTSSDCKYDNVHNRLKPYGAYKATHLANYNNVGVTDLVATDSDYVKAANDVRSTASDTNEDSDSYTEKIPHIIKSYTPKKSDTEYPAFNLAAFDMNKTNEADAEKKKTETDELYLNIEFSSSGDTIYYMPDGFRGLGCMLLGEGYWTILADGTPGFKDNANGGKWLLNTMNVNSLTGNGRIISLNMDFMLYNADNYGFPGGDTDANLKTGFGFFNALRSDYTETKDNKLKDLIFKGTVKYDVINNSTGKHLEISASTYVRPAIGGFIGAPGVDTNNDGGGGDMWIENISLNNLAVSGVLYAGGLVGCSNASKTYSFINCSADNLEVTGGTAVGGLIGYIRHGSSNIFCDFYGNDFGIISVVSRANWAGDTGGYTAAGALFGDNYSNLNGAEQGVTVKNVNIKNATSTNTGYIGYSTVSNNTDRVKAGGIVGIVSRGSRMEISGVTVENINVKGYHSGGFIGHTGGSPGSIPITITDCKITTDQSAVIENVIADGTSGGVVGNWQSADNYPLTIKNTEVIGYNVKGAKYCGGLVGRKLNVNTLECDNITIDGVIISTNEKGGGLVGAMSNGSMNGYNILVTGLSFDRYNGSGNVATWGYIAGRNENKDIKLAGFSRQGTIDVAATVGTFDTNMYGADGYVVFADYTDKATTEPNDEFSNIISGAKNVARTGTGANVTNTKKIYTGGEPSIIGTPATETVDFDSTLGDEVSKSYSATKLVYDDTDYINRYGKVTSIDDFTGSRANSGFYLYIYRSNTNQYFSSELNSKGCFKEETSIAKAAKWYFEKEGDNYKVYTYVNGTKKYIHNKSSNELELSNQADLFEISSTGSNAENYLNSFFFKKYNDSNNYYLQHSNGGGGIRYYGGNSDNNAKVMLQFADTTTGQLRAWDYDTVTIEDNNVITPETPTTYRNATAEEIALYGDGTADNYYVVTEVVKENNFRQDANLRPLVTTSPKRYITDNNQFLTGDGVLSQNYLSSALRYIVDDQKNEAEKAYTTCPTPLGLSENVESLTALRNELSSSYTEFRSYINANGNNGITNFPILVAEDTDQTKLTPLINNYLQNLTNTDYNFADRTKTAIYEVGLYKCTFDEENRQFDVKTTESCLKRRHVGTEDYFFMDAGDVDTQDTPQFTLMDVQFKDPSNTSLTAYHLYVPIYVKKVLRFDFNAHIKSGTDYYWSAYDKVGVLRRQGLFENLGNPVTIAFEWEYDRSAKDWADAVNGGDSLLTNYYKSLVLKRHNDTNDPNDGNGDWAANTRMILVDVNNNDKMYYLDIPPNTTSTGKTFSLYDFVAIDGTHYKPVDFNDLMTVVIEQDNEGTLTPNNVTKDGTTVNTAEGATVYDGTTYYRPITESDTGLNVEDRYTVSSVTLPKPERYYLSIFTKANTDNIVYHYEMYSPDSFDDSHMADTTKHRANRINDDKNTVMHLFTGNLYENDLALNVNSKTSNPLMSADNDFLTITMTANIRLTDTAKLAANNIGGNMSTFKDNAEIYQTFLMMYDKLDSVEGTSKIGIEPDAGSNPVQSVKYYYKGGAVDGALSDVKIIPENGNDYGGTQITTAESKVSDKYVELRNNLSGKQNLIALLSDSSNDNAVTIQVKFDMFYASTDLVYQFPKKSEGTSGDIGSSVIGYSKIASTKESAAYSTTSKKATDSTRYYTADVSTAKLTYNVVEAPDDDPTGPYSSLGINAIEVTDPYESPIDTIAVYDVSKLKNPGDYIEISFSLSKRGDYNTKLPIESYLTGVTIYGNDQNEDGKDDVIFLQTDDEVDGENRVTTKGENEYKVRVNKNLLKTQPGGSYIIPIEFNVKTGNSAFDNGKLEYSNYKVTVSAAIYSTIDGDGISSVSYGSDHIIYTNARVLTSVVE